MYNLVDVQFSAWPILLQSQRAVRVSHVEQSGERVVNSQHNQLYSARLPHTLIWQIDYHRAAMLLTFICDLPLHASLSLHKFHMCISTLWIYTFFDSIACCFIFVNIFCSATVTLIFLSCLCLSTLGYHFIHFWVITHFISIMALWKTTEIYHDNT